ncbi:uncharacterized mitochondrial protein AtMg01250-like [Rutidosis leptorrhynchoides]|uniref:uncharacterized mitochondrial protein AtMg01250-like n=1 Tax=Rutidosis leptorrhynchoides TaxID=125765 RepID=UPI003A9A379D
MEELKRCKRKSFVFKADFEKTFDSLNWQYLLTVLELKGFGVKWRSWILSYLKSASISVLVNGSPTKEFSLMRGVRQGNPLSPYLFILATEGPSLLTKKAIEKRLYKGVEIGTDKVMVSHLQYADDTIFFGDWSKNNAKNLMKLLMCFEKISGLKVNLSKSCLYQVGVSIESVESLASVLGCNMDKFPISYLDLPIGSQMNKVKDWIPFIENNSK